MRWLLVFSVLTLMSGAYGEALLYDMGAEDSALMQGFQRVTEEDVYSAQRGFGWDKAEGLRTYVAAYKDPIENKSAGRTDPPPIYTNALTEDCIVGERPRAFRVRAPQGDLRVYVLCGTSYNLRNQYFDFTVGVGGEQTRVRFEGGYQFRNRRFAVRAAGDTLTIALDPRSKWVINAVMVWTGADDERMKEMIEGLHEQMYGLPREVMAKWKEDPPPLTVALDKDRVPAQDMARGFAIFHKPYVECVYPNTNPYTHELDPQLRIFASPGEYEPLTFSVRAFEPLQDVTVSTQDIGPVKGDTVDVRHVRYMRARPNYRTYERFRVVPDVLEKFDRLSLPAEHTHRFWLTVNVPKTAEPGLYAGAIVFHANGHTRELPVRLRVLNIELREDPDKVYGIYYRDPLDRWASADDEVSKAYFRRKSQLEHADMVAHGTRNVTMSAWCKPEDDQGNYTADWTALQAKLDMAREYDFKPPYVMSINTGGVYRKHMNNESYGSHLRSVKVPPQAFFDEMTRMAAFVEAERVKYGWPEFLYYPVDEPGTSAAAVEFMTRLLEAIRKAGVKTYVTADPVREAFEPMRPFVNVWCCQPFNPQREVILKDMAERDVQYWCYPNHVNGENDHTPVAGARMTYGFGLWRSGFRALIPWIYQANIGDPFNYLDGSAQDFFNRSEPEGTPVPVAMWEAYREGYDDYRYVYTLESLIREARQAGRREAADQAEKQLQYVWEAIRVQTKYKYDDLWAPEEFDVYRWLIAGAILKLQGSA